MNGRKTIVSGNELVALVPPVRIRHLVGVHVPAVIVPVPVDRAAHTTRFVPKAIRATARRILSGLYLIWDIKVHQLLAPNIVIF